MASAASEKKSSERKFSLSRTRRVRKRSEFLYLQSKGRKVRSDHFLLVFAPRAQRGENAQSRLGITITKRIDKRAVIRNRLKRRIRNIFRVQRPAFQAAFDVVIIAQDGSGVLSFAEIRHQLCSLLSRAQILPRTSKA